MCESKAIELTEAGEKLLLDDVALLENKDDAIILYNIEGKKIELPKDQYVIARIDFLKHKIYFRRHGK